jgi:rhodanese-related sulfurtransferase
MKKFFAIAIGTLSTAVLLSGCGSSNAKKVSPKEFSEVTQQAGIVVLDVRTPEEFAEGHLANAINIDFQSGNFEEEISKLDKSKTYAVYCRSGNRSGQAVKDMSDLGFTNIYDMDGGIIDWVNAGGQLVTN